MASKVCRQLVCWKATTFAVIFDHDNNTTDTIPGKSLGLKSN